MDKPYQLTRLYRERVAQLDAAKVTLEGELLLLAGTNRGTKTKRQHLQDIVTKRKDGEDSSKYTRLDILRMWFDALDGWLGGYWTDFDRAFDALKRASHEGRWEKAIKHRLGRPTAPSQGDIDIPNESDPTTGDEVKEEDFRLGKLGHMTYIRFLASLPEALTTEKMWDGSLSSGDLVASPEGLRELVLAAFAPEIVLARYTGIWLVFNEGFAYIPREHFAQAFEYQRVTQYSVKYELRRGYVEDLLWGRFSLQQQPQVTA